MKTMVHKCKPVIKIGILLVGFFTLGCRITFSPPPKGPCPIDTLLIGKESVPSTIFYETGSRTSEDAPARVGIEKIGTSFSSYNKGGVVQHVYRFKDEVEALQEYKNISEYFFRKEKNTMVWLMPDAIDSLNPRADAFQVACSTITDVVPNVEVCRFLAQNGPYETDLEVTMIALDYSDLSKLITEIDHKMNLCLDRN